jgi:hypothetical protein
MIHTVMARAGLPSGRIISLFALHCTLITAGGKEQFCAEIVTEIGSPTLAKVNLNIAI